ncbi:MAG: hypothetical protein ACWGHO_02460 [Candidatus Moraniibacteriota bacterium]
MNEISVATVDQGVGLSLTREEAAMILSKSPIFRRRSLTGGIKPFKRGERQTMINEYLSTFKEADQKRRTERAN